MKFLQNFSNSSAKNKRGNPILFAVLLALFALMAWRVVRPMMMTISSALLLAYLVSPLYGKMQKLTDGKYLNLCALLSLIIALLLLVFPTNLLISAIHQELLSLGGKLLTLLNKFNAKDTAGLLASLPAKTPQFVVNYLTELTTDSETLSVAADKLATWLARMLTTGTGRVVTRAFGMIFATFIMFIISFFFLRDGEDMAAYTRQVLPLSEEENELFYGRCKALLQALVFGVICMDLIQSICIGTAWWLVGLNNPVFYAILAFFCGLLPCGTLLVWIPASVYLLMTGNPKFGILFALWCMLSGVVINNILRPALISSGSGIEIPTPLIIIGICGGMAAWGFIGIFFGPMVLMLFKLLFEIYCDRTAK